MALAMLTKANTNRVQAAVSLSRVRNMVYPVYHPLMPGQKKKGREFSSRPRGHYGPSLVARQRDLHAAVGCLARCGGVLRDGVLASVSRDREPLVREVARGDSLEEGLH